MFRKKTRGQVIGAELQEGFTHIGNAVAEASRAVELDPDDPTARFNRGLAALAAGDPRSARSDFEQAERQLGLPPLPWWRRWTG